jgi:hypothetical protein
MLVRPYPVPRVRVRDDGLTDHEGAVMDFLSGAVDVYEDLEEQHPQERDEFYAAIHRLQDLLACRAMRRLYPKGWVNDAAPLG